MMRTWKHTYPLDVGANKQNVEAKLKNATSVFKTNWKLQIPQEVKLLFQI